MQNHRNPDIVMGTDGSVSDLKWELVVKVHWGKAIRPLLQKIHDKYLRTVVNIKTAWRNLKSRLRRLGTYQKDNSTLTTNGTLSQILNKRGPFLDTIKGWYHQDEESGQIVHLIRKWNHAPLPKTEDTLQLNIISPKDSKQSVAIPLQHYQLTLEGYRRIDTLFYRTMDFSNETDIVTNLEGLRNEIAKALDNSLFSGIRSVIP